MRRVSGPAVAVLAWLALAAGPGVGPARGSEAPGQKRAAARRPRAPILLTMRRLVDELDVGDAAADARRGRRLAFAGGVLGLGPYDPAGGSDLGVKAPPLHLFPRAGLGNSLNVDPVTGRPY
jgi:hypothetical protein